MGCSEIATTGTRIRDKREEAGLSQEELSKKLGYSRQKLAKIETDERGVKISDLVKIAAVLHCSCDSLIYGTKSPEEVSVSHEIGLSGEAIHALKDDPNLSKLIDCLLSQQKGIEFLEIVGNYLGRMDDFKKQVGIPLLFQEKSAKPFFNQFYEYIRFDYGSKMCDSLEKINCGKLQQDGWKVEGTITLDDLYSGMLMNNEGGE